MANIFKFLGCFPTGHQGNFNQNRMFDRGLGWWVQEMRVLFRIRGRLGNVLTVYSSLKMLLQQSRRAPGSLNIYKMPDT